MPRLGLPRRLQSFASPSTTASPTVSSSTPPASAALSSAVSPSSRSNSAKQLAMEPKSTASLALRVTVVKGRNLAAKDRGGTSDPYLVLTLGDAKQATPAINKTLNPEWNQTLDLPIVGEQSLLLEGCCWDKDRFGKDYMGEFDVVLEDVFQNGAAVHEPRWIPLQSRRTGRKKSVVTGEVLLQFALVDPADPAVLAPQLLQRFSSFASSSSAVAAAATADDDDDDDDDNDDDDDALLHLDSGEHEPDDDESPGEPLDESQKAEVRERRRKKLRLARLRRNASRRAYEFSDKSEVAGVLFLEISKITDLPPERNVTRTSFDMDPFVVTSLGRKTYRTRVINHCLNPVFDEKLVFQVLWHETKYSLQFTVVDRDKFSGNDYIGAVSFPLDKVVAAAPDADPTTGLYRLPEPQDSLGLPEARRSRFRLPMSRSSSAHSLTKLARPSLKKEGSAGSLPSQKDALAPAGVAAPTSVPPTPGLSTPGLDGSVPAVTVEPSGDDADFCTFALPVEMKSKERWESKHSPMLHIRTKYLPYRALRQQFWRAMLKQYDADESGLIDKIELTTMLDTLGSTLHESTINGYFERFGSGDEVLTFDQAVVCLEDELQKGEDQSHGRKGLLSRLMPSGPGDTPGSVTPSGASGTTTTTPHHTSAAHTAVPTLSVEQLGLEGDEGEHMEGLSDEKGEEHVVEIRECPICHQPRLNKKSDADILTHVATCASQDWRQVNNIVMAGFVTSSQAQRKWYSKVITKISYGGYKLGANSANILVQDRMTGQINEERMSVYVRLGIRLLYKGLKANSMEKKRIRKLLRSLSFKQGRKYDDPASAAEIEGFVAFHQLDMSEVLLPTAQFKNFNEFFYRALKPGARPCSVPDDARVATSPADCRTVLFNRMDEAQAIWVKGREFTVQRLLGSAYPDDAKRFVGGALGIFRLAPQDYHRFHVPVDGVLGEPRAIEGEYYTVNPMAIRSALDVYGENVRVVVPIDSVAHGRVMVVCIGAMMVGSTVITRKAGERVARAEELGYFKFGGSTILLLFAPGQLVWDDDLAENSRSALETLVRVGMSIGHHPERAAHANDMRKENPTHEEKQDAKRRIEGSLAPDGAQGPMAGAGM